MAGRTGGCCPTDTMTMPTACAGLLCPQLTGPRCIYGPRGGGGSTTPSLGRLPQICGHPSGDLGGPSGDRFVPCGWAVPPLPRGLAGAGDRPGRALCQPGAQSAAQGGGGPVSARRLFPRAVSWCWRPARGLVVLNSCSHGGCASTSSGACKDQLPGQPVYALLGGLHMLSPEGPHAASTVPRTMSAQVAGAAPLEAGSGAPVDGPLHWSLPPLSLLKEELGDRVEPPHRRNDGELPE